MTPFLPLNLLGAVCLLVTLTNLPRRKLNLCACYRDHTFGEPAGANSDLNSMNIALSSGTAAAITIQNSCTAQHTQGDNNLGTMPATPRQSPTTLEHTQTE